MSTVKPLVTTAGATLALGIIGTVPANAAQLEFNFLTENGASGSFTLNTSVPKTGFAQVYQNAVTDFKYSGLEASTPLNVSAGVFEDGGSYPPVDFSLFDISDSSFVSNGPKVTLFLQLYFNNPNLGNRLSDNPDDYSSYFSGDFAGNFAGYGGGFESLPGGFYEGDPEVNYFVSRVTSVSVRKLGDGAVPEPETVLGSFVGFTFLGMLWLKKRLQQKST